jgi:hypothetical protein
MFRVPIENRRQGDVAPRAIHGIIVGRVLGQKGAERVYFPDTGTIATRAHWIKSPLNQNMFNLTGTGGILAGVDPKNKLIADDSQVTDDSDVPELIYDDTGESTESTESSMTLSHLVNLVKDVAMKRPKHVLSEQDPVKKKAGIQAMVNECKSMIKYGVFAPHDHRVRTETRPLRSNTFIKEKYKANGDWDKTKCRMTGSGNEQDDDTFGETSSPTADTSSSLIILNVASRYKVKVKSWDAPCAFLNSILEELVYMCIEPIMAKILIELCPELVIGLRPDGWLIVRLVKALYGLKQAGLMWYKTLRKFMESLGFYVSSKDQGVFIKRDGNDWIYVTVHVDDLLIVAKSDELSTWLTDSLQKEYGESDVQVDNLSHLGMNIVNDTKTGIIRLNQIGYIETYLEKYNIVGNRQTKTPSSAELYDPSEDSEQASDEDQVLFRSQVMSLMYLAKRTRPDFLKEVAWLATKCAKATVEDLSHLNRLNVYLANTVKYEANIYCKSLTIHCYSDASHMVHSDCKGHTGVTLSLGSENFPFMVISKKQKLVSRSSTEAELIALDEGVVQVMWARQFLIELGQGVTSRPSKIFQDNKSTIVLAHKGPTGQGKSKHIANKFFYVTQCIDSRDVEVLYLPTEMMIADILTKPLSGQLFDRMRALLLCFRKTAA